jgi:Lon protease-like protein
MVLARGAQRIRVKDWLPDDPYPRAVIGNHPSPVGREHGPALDNARSALARLRSLLSELGHAPALPPDLRIAGTDDQVGWTLCELAPLGPMDRQALLAAPDLSRRMALLAELCDAAAGDVVHLLSGGPG